MHNSSISEISNLQSNAADLSRYKVIRAATEEICKPLSIEDYVVQPIEDVSPPKWHLGHTTWFFETFILQQFKSDYIVFDPNFNFVFNSYYETVGARVIRTDRGNLSRPTVDQVYAYRKYVDNAITDFLSNSLTDEAHRIFNLGLQHEQQHQELLLTDIKYVLGHNPLLPAYSEANLELSESKNETEFIELKGGVYEIGFCGDGFCFDNELGKHKVYLDAFEIASNLVTNREYLEFIESEGYKNFRLWHAEGWDWIKNNNVSAPMYWHKIDGEWFYYSLGGLSKIDLAAPATHVNFYEAFAFAAWKGMRLPTEFEWEVASDNFSWGKRWEWTNSAYLPYPGFATAADATGEYNGKFMISQMVLRGSSIATPKNHGRNTYRNFFHPKLQWQFTGIRLTKSL